MLLGMKTRLGRAYGVGFLGLFGVACAAATPSSKEPAGVSETPAEVKTDEPSPAETSPVSSEATETAEGPSEPKEDPVSAAPPAPDGPEIVAGICEEICAKTDKACSERAATFCRASCRDYVTSAEKCPVEIEDALRCQSEADDFLLCSNIAAESCAPLYRDMKACREGTAEPKKRDAQAVSAGPNAPEGWATREVPSFGFSVLMPEADLSEKEGGFRAVAEMGGHRFVVEPLETEGRKPNAKRILRWASQYVGNDCQPKLRLHGRFESKGVIHVRFDTVCADESERHGMLHLWPNKGVVAVIEQKTGEAPLESSVSEKFLFSFASLK